MSAARTGVSLVAIGDELLAGRHPDLNSPEIAARLFEHGWLVESTRIVPDDEERIAAAVAEGLATSRLVVVTGGLGPTLDDVTRHGAARAVGVELEERADAVRALEAWFAERGRPMAAGNKRQALLPRGATLLENPVGTAPGFRLEHDGATLFVLPGPPREMREMLARELLPWVEAQPDGGRVFAYARSVFEGLSESVFAEGVGAWMERGANPLMGVTVSEGVLIAHLRGWGEDAVQARERVELRARELVERFAGEHLGEESDLAQGAGAALLARGWTIATAESCTAGLVSARLAEVPGISASLLAGFTTYSNEAKHELLGVPTDLLERHGAVSCPVAEAMARGARERAGSDVAVSVTGVAGPGGGSPEKPVGFVCFATDVRGEVRSTERHFPPFGRGYVRALATNTALALVLRRLAER